MQVFFTLLLIGLVLGLICSALSSYWHRKRAATVKKKMYKELEKRAKHGDQQAMYQLAEQFYHEDDAQYYPLIFKWVSLLAAQKKDPAVWLTLGDLWAHGYGTERDYKRAISCYEQALAADIAAGRYTNLSREAHNYLEERLMHLRMSRVPSK